MACVHHTPKGWLDLDQTCRDMLLRHGKRTDYILVTYKEVQVVGTSHLFLSKTFLVRN